MSVTSPPPSFDDAMLALLASLESGDPLDHRDYDVLVAGLGRFLRARFANLHREEAIDAVNDGLARFIAAARDGKVDPEGKPAAYLTRTAEHAALDALRARRREGPVPDERDELEEDDTRLEAVLDTLASRALFRQLMEVAGDRGEHDLTALIATYLNLAAGETTPTLRQLGEALGVSHTEARRRLDRLERLARERGIV